MGDGEKKKKKKNGGKEGECKRRVKMRADCPYGRGYLINEAQTCPHGPICGHCRKSGLGRNWKWLSKSELA